MSDRTFPAADVPDDALGGGRGRPRRVTVAIPVYNEEAVLPELLRRLAEVLDGVAGGPHEIVLVDDGSEDGSREVLRRAAAADPRICLVELSRNFGHQAAITAALDHAAGDVVVVMDADLQDPPEAIPDLLAPMGEGYDVVFARRVGRKEGVVLRAGYHLFYRIAARLSRPRLPVDAGDFAALSRQVVDELIRLPERHRYLRGLRAWVGFRQTGVDVERGRRWAGDSKYTVAGLLRLGFDGLFAFSLAPIRAATLLGLGAVVSTGLYAAYALLAKLLWDVSPRGFTALLLAFVFMSGIQLLILGVLGEYVGRIYEEAKRRPHYVVRRVLRGG